MLHSSRGNRRPRSLPYRHPQRRRLALETLETRNLLSGETVLLSGSYTTLAAAAEAAAGTYPAQWTWDAADTLQQPAAATGGTPLVKQYRGGQLIASYSILGGGVWGQPNSYLSPYTASGPFSRSPYRNWADGDVFEVYPAVYSGVNNQPWIGPMFDNDAQYTAGVSHTPTNITIRGVTVNGVRPVIKLDAAGASNNTLGQSAIYVDQSVNLTIENIDIDGSAAGPVGKAGIYLNGADNVTLRNMRIHGFRHSNANGIFGTGGDNARTVTIVGVELYDNGGDGGPEHNIYINASEVDPNYTVHMVNCWSHDAYYGHTFKSRAQVNIIEGNYFEGGVPQAGKPQAEAYLVDVPNGGRLVMRNNVLVKNASGPNSNGASVTFATEGLDDARPLSITIENNTFVAFARYYDGSHENWPFFFFYPQQVPGSANFPVPKVSIQRNVFVGYRPTGNAVLDYRGSQAVVAGFADINADFSLKTNYVTADTSIVGTPAYGHAALIGKTRRLATIGARDAAGTPTTASIGGCVWNDLNGVNGKNAGEPGLAGWIVYLDANGNGTLDAGEQNAVTDANGAYQFGNLAAGTYRVREVVKAGWRATYPTTSVYTVTLAAGQSLQDRSFGNQALPAAVSGYVWNDLNGSGVKNPGEPALIGWTVYLDTNGNGALDRGEQSAVTDAAGAYRFANLAAGTYTVRQVTRAGWATSYPTTGVYTVTLAAGQSRSGLAFGDQLATAAISGYVWNDLDGVGGRSYREPLLAGWTVYLDANGNGTLDPGERTVVTDAAGAYRFANLTAGTYTVREVVKAGWRTTYPKTGAYTMTLAAGQSLPGILFGNQVLPAGIAHASLIASDGHLVSAATEPPIRRLTPAGVDLLLAVYAGA